MSKIYIISTQYIGDDYFFNNNNITDQKIQLHNHQKTDLYKVESSSHNVILYGFHSTPADYPPNTDKFLDDLKDQLKPSENDEIFYILHDRILNIKCANFLYRDRENVAGFQHEDYDFIGKFLRTFKGDAETFAERADYLLTGIGVYKKLQSEIENGKNDIDKNDYLMMQKISKLKLSDSDCKCMSIRQKLRKKMKDINSHN